MISTLLSLIHPNIIDAVVVGGVLVGLLEVFGRQVSNVQRQVEIESNQRYREQNKRGDTPW